MNIDSEKIRVNVDLSLLRESLKKEPIDNIELLRSLNSLISSLGNMKIKVIETLDKSKDFL